MFITGNLIEGASKIPQLEFPTKQVASLKILTKLSLDIFLIIFIKENFLYLLIIL